MGVNARICRWQHAAPCVDAWRELAL